LGRIKARQTEPNERGVYRENVYSKRNGRCKKQWHGNTNIVWDLFFAILAHMINKYKLLTVLILWAS
jgi:hypothetical protein